MSRIYLASSWRNPHHTNFLERLRKYHDVFDFRATQPCRSGGPVPTAFSWGDCDPKWSTWTPYAYRTVVTQSQLCASGFLGDFRGMEWADTCVLLLPCGRSAHIEAGYMKGRGRRLVIAYPDNTRVGFDPDLMYLLADNITVGADELVDLLGAAT